MVLRLSWYVLLTGRQPCMAAAAVAGTPARGTACAFAIVLQSVVKSLERRLRQQVATLSGWS